MVDEGGREGSSKVQQGEAQAIGPIWATIRAMADTGGDAMRSMSMDPVSAARQTLAAVRHHPYIPAMLLLGLPAIIVGFVRS